MLSLSGLSSSFLLLAEQLDEIRQVSFARILCDNTDVGEMQPLAFVTPSRTL
jgi:hypothetical protein